MIRSVAEGDVRGELLAAGERVFASRGYAAATVDDVVRESGTSRASFYRYFTGKEQLFEELSRVCYREMRDALRALSSAEPGPPGSSRIRELLRGYQALNERYGGVIRAWTELSGPGDTPLRERGTAAMRAMFDETGRVLARAQAVAPAGTPAPPAQAALLFLLIERSSFYVSNRVSRLDPARLLPTLATLVERGYLGTGV